VTPLNLISATPTLQENTSLSRSRRLRLKLVFSCKVGVYCFCIQARGLVFGYSSTVVISVLSVLCNLRSSALEFTLQNFVNLCNQQPPEGIRMHQIRFAPGLRPGPRWGSSITMLPRPPSRMGRGIPLPHTPPPRRLRRLDLGAFGACCY